MLVPKKSLGQNFLIDKNLCKKITKSLNIKNKIIIEIGPGTGQLTDEIIKLNPKKLILIEKDNKLFKLLKKKYIKLDYMEILNIDAINLDVTAIVNKYYGDTSRMFTVGDVSVKAKNLIDATYESMMKAIKILKPGIKLGDIGFEIQSYIEDKGFSVVRDFCGHGISNIFHEPPNVLHYGKKNTGVELKPGMTFTIEPMINAGKLDVKVLNDGWTAVTKDKSLSAQFEHTVGITENSYEIFTESVKEYRKPPYN